MGIVFEGLDLQTHQRVAIKFLSPEHCRKPKLRTRFEREAQAMARLKHPNIISVLGHGMHGALPFIVMEFLEGQNLAEALSTHGGPFTLPEALPTLQQVAAGLTELHRQGFVHRDLKPQNIFLCSDDHRVIILDFGAVRNIETPGLTRPGAMLGTPYYMSPEQILGVKDIDYRTDIYALAAVTFELLTGRPPFPGKSSYVVLTGHKNTPVPNATDIEPSLPAEVSDVLRMGLAKRRDERPVSAEAFFADLETAAQPPRREERTQLIDQRLLREDELGAEETATLIVPRLQRKPR
jgi:serine/threonine protein kinase